MVPNDADPEVYVLPKLCDFFVTSCASLRCRPCSGATIDSLFTYEFVALVKLLLGGPAEVA